MDNFLNHSDGPAVRDAQGEALSRDGIRQASPGGISVRQYSLLCCLLGRLEGVREAIPKAVRPFYADTLRLLEALAKELRPDAK